MSLTPDRADRPGAPLDAYAVRERNADRVAAISAWALGTIADVGCGNGAYVAASPAGSPAIGVDATVFPAWRSLPHRFVVGDAARLPLRDAGVDTVLCFEVLEHMPDALVALRELGRVARQRVIVTVPNCAITPGMKRSNLIYHHWIDPTHRNFFDAASLSALIASAGLRMVHAGAVNAIDTGPFVAEALRFRGLPAKAVARAVRRAQRRYPMTLLAVAEPV